MEKFNIPERIIDEVEELIDIDKEDIKEEEVSIMFDGNQYSFKIPKKIADIIEINHKKDRFVLKVTTYPIEEDKKPTLDIYFKRE